MIDENQNKSGYGFDFLQHMVGYTNWKYEYVGYDKSWNDIQDMLENGEIDLLSSAQKTAARSERFDFSERSIGTSSAILTVKDGDTKYIIKDYSHWNGMRIGQLVGNSRNQDLKDYAEEKGFTYTSVFYNSTDELIDSLQKGTDIDAIVTSNLRSINNETILAKFAPSPFYIMVKKGNTTLLSKINETLEILYNDHPSLENELMAKYYTPKSSNQIAFTVEERQFIEEMKNTSIKAIINPDRAPLSYYSDNNLSGIIGEITKEIIKRSNLNIEILKLENREEYLSYLNNSKTDICLDFIHNFSTAEKYDFHLASPYLNAGISKLYLKKNGKRNTAGLVKGSYIIEELVNEVENNYSKVNYYDTTESLVNDIEKGKCDVGFLYTRVAEKTVVDDERNRLASELLYGYTISFGCAIRSGNDTRLFSILDKATASLSDEEINNIIKKYTVYDTSSKTLLGFIYDNPLIFTAFLSTFFILLILAVFSILSNQKRKQESKFLSYEKSQNVILSDALTSAQSANEAKSVFLSHMSHEMRTPLNAVIGFMELAKGASKEEQDVYFNNSEVAAKQLLSIINDVLDMSSINSGKIKISNSLFDFKELLQNINILYQSQCISKGLEFEINIKSPIDEWLIGDKLRLNQILINLLGNAVKFTEKGFIHLSILEREIENDKIFISFSVQDTGVGMSENMLSRIGQPFEHENPEISQKYGGTGLGLSIVKMLSSLMGGAFKVESTLGVGSTFTIDLPFERAQKKVDPNIINNFVGLHVLTINDIETEKTYLSTILDRIKVRHTSINKSEEALKELERGIVDKDPYNVCIVELKKNNTDGLSLTNLIRSKYPKDMTLIVFSLYDNSEVENELKEAGADMFILKPVLQSSLVDLFMSITSHEIKEVDSVKCTYDFEGKHILLAEDNLMNQMVAKALIKKNRYYR